MSKLTNVTFPWSSNVQFSTGVAVVAVLCLAPLFGWALASEEWLIAGVLGLVVFIPVFIKWPVISTFGVYALLVSSFDTLPLLQGFATLSRPAGALTAGVLLIVGLMERRLVRPPSAAVWWALFVMWALVSVAWAVDVGMAFRRLTTVLSLVLLYLVTASFRPTQREFHSICALTVLGGVLAASAGYFFGLEGGYDRGRLVIGDFDSNPNNLGRMLVPPFAIAVVAFIGLHGVARKAIAIGCVGVIGLGIYITMSRAALLAMMVVISVVLYRLQARKQIILVVIVLLMMLAAAPARFFDRVGKVVTGEDATGSGRTEIWQVGFDELQQFWLFGAGLNNFPALSDGVGAHNSYLGIAVELGVIGLALMFGAIVSHFWASHGATTRAVHGMLALAAVEAATVGMLTGAMFADRTWTKTFWLMWTLMVWAIYCSKPRSAVAEASRGRLTSPAEASQQRVSVR